MLIAQQSGENCVARGLSTMRAVLGYDTPIPEGYVLHGAMQPFEVINEVPLWFPDHNPIVYASKNEGELAGNPAHFAGDTLKLSESDADTMLIGFSYYLEGRHDGHFVIGAPTLYGDMRVAFTVCVEMEDV